MYDHHYYIMLAVIISVTYCSVPLQYPFLFRGGSRIMWSCAQYSNSIWQKNKCKIWLRNHLYLAKVVSVFQVGDSSRSGSTIFTLSKCVINLFDSELSPGQRPASCGREQFWHKVLLEVLRALKTTLHFELSTGKYALTAKTICSVCYGAAGRIGRTSRHRNFSLS